MFVFGHMGIGSKIVSPWSTGLSRRWLLLGTVLPDLVDKPLYYGLSWATGKSGSDLGLISGTRTFGHSAILLLVVTGVAVARRSRIFAALALGMATHLLLDSVSQTLAGGTDPYQGILLAIAFPVMGWRFPVYPFRGLDDQVSTLLHPGLLGAEVIGLALLGWNFWKTRHENEILGFLRQRRMVRHEREKRRKELAAGRHRDGRPV